jgi:hypothetical protein
MIFLQLLNLVLIISTSSKYSWLYLSKCFQKIKLLRGRRGRYPEKTTDLPQVTDKLYYIMLYRENHRPAPSHWQTIYTTLCNIVCQWLAAGRWFSRGTLVSSANKIDSHDITEILLKVVLNNISPKEKLCEPKCTMSVLLLGFGIVLIFLYFYLLG